ncbi:MAG: MFS transporter [Bacteroidetes bacterium]|nr:MFS transporter [Bacteroidota bacterium]
MCAKRLYTSQTSTQGLLPVRPGFWVLLLYALGQLGWSMASFAVSNLLIYFYMPPEQGAPMFPVYLYQGSILGVLTLIGIISAGGRLLDAFIDPFIANWSDRKNSHVGKRRWFMLVGAIPLAFCATAVFFPTDQSESATNFVWLTSMVALYYFFFAFYVIPYTALIPELGHTAADRMQISTLVSITWALGYVFGTQVFQIQAWFSHMGMSAVSAFQRAVLLLHILSLVFMLLPALFLKEKKYARQSPSEDGLWAAIRMVFKNQNFRWFLTSDLLYWLSLNFIQLGVGYYTTILLQLDIEYASRFSLIGFLCSFAFYWPVNRLVGLLGKRKLILWAFAAFALIFTLVSTAHWIPLKPESILYLLGFLSAFPLAVFGILPNAVIGDIVQEAEQIEGKQNAGMFYGVRAFVMKLGISISNLIFPSLLLLGKSIEHPGGVQASAVTAVAICLAGWWAFRKYEDIPLF